MKRILIIEDQAAIRRMLELNLKIAGYETVSIEDGTAALEYLNGSPRCDLALVDVMLPGVDGFMLLPHLNEKHIPVIFLTARGDLEARLQGLTGGAEDYIVKPFDMPELLVRMEKVLARNGSKEEPVFEAVRLDLSARIAYLDGKPLTLTPMEFDLLELFVRNPNSAFSRQRLLDQVWGIRYEGGTRTVDVHVAQLRRKTGLNLVSVPKIGYRLEANP